MRTLKSAIGLWTLFLVLLLLAYEYLQISLQGFSNRLDSQASQRLIDKADGNLDLLEVSLLRGDTEKTRSILKQISQGERVACLSLNIEGKWVSYPEVCDLKLSDATLAVSSKSGATLKIDTSLSFYSETMGFIRNAFGALALGCSFLLGAVAFASLRKKKS